MNWFEKIERYYKKFTFQYGSTLMIFLDAFAKDEKTIYIPIWFYFNLIKSNVRCFISTIYIPIWFYFNFFIDRATWGLDLIYIPIWFYFNYLHI